MSMFEGGMFDSFFKLVCCAKAQEKRGRHVSFRDVDDAPRADAAPGAGQAAPVRGSQEPLICAIHSSRSVSCVGFLRGSELSHMVSQLEELGSQLGVLCLKYPKEGRNNGSARSRYVAVMPCDFRKDVAETADEGAKKLRFWKQGRIAYWRDQEAYRGGAQPKAMVSLASVLEAQWTTERPCDVVLKYAAVSSSSMSPGVTKGNAQEPDTSCEGSWILQMGSIDQARYWKNTLTELLQILRSTEVEQLEGEPVVTYAHQAEDFQENIKDLGQNDPHGDDDDEARIARRRRSTTVG